MTIIEMLGLLRVAAQPGPWELTAERQLLEAGLVERDLELNTFHLTPRGAWHVRQLAALPLPEVGS